MLQENRNTIKFAILYTFMFIACPLLCVATMKGSNNLMILNIAIYIIIAIGCIALMKPQVKVLTDTIKRHPVKLVLLGILSYICIMIANVVVSMLTGKYESTGNQEGINEMLSLTYVTLILLVVIAPVVEEIFFRQILIGELGKKIPTWICCVISILIFAALHISSFSYAGLMEARAYIVAGTVYTMLYVINQKNIAYPIVAHTINNLVSAIVMLRMM